MISANTLKSRLLPLIFAPVQNERDLRSWCIEPYLSSLLIASDNGESPYLWRISATLRTRLTRSSSSGSLKQRIFVPKPVRSGNRIPKEPFDRGPTCQDFFVVRRMARTDRSPGRCPSFRGIRRQRRSQFNCSPPRCS